MSDDLGYAEFKERPEKYAPPTTGVVFMAGSNSLRDAAIFPPPGEYTVTAGKAKTYDEGKAPLAWLPWDAILAMNEIQVYGHAKYQDFNNYRKGMEVSRNLSCALRHIMHYLQGEDLDPESNKPHLAHAMCRLAFVLQNISDGTAIDDRYSKLPPSST